MKPKTMEPLGRVACTDVNDFDRAAIDLRAGDVVHWKRNGRRGILTCRVLGFIAGASCPLRLQPISTSGADDGQPIAVSPEVIKAFRDGARIGIPAAFESTVVSYEYDEKRSWGWVEVARPGFRNISFNNRAAGWPAATLSAGQVVLVSAEQLPGDSHVTWFIEALGRSKSL